MCSSDLLELAQRIAVGVYLGEARPHVLLSQLGDIHHGILPRRLAHLGASQRRRSRPARMRPRDLTVAEFRLPRENAALLQ